MKTEVSATEDALKEDLKLLVNCHWKPPETIIEIMAKKKWNRKLRKRT